MFMAAACQKLIGAKAFTFAPTGYGLIPNDSAPTALETFPRLLLDLLTLVGPNLLCPAARFFK
jgi:hypothetical protein